MPILQSRVGQRSNLMSASGQKRTCAMQNGMSALPRKRHQMRHSGMSAVGQERTSRGVLSASTLPFDLVIAIASCAGPTHLIVRVTEEVLMAASARPRVIGFNHVALEVGDIDEALEFYGRLFRFELRGKSDSMAFIDLGDQFIALQKGRRQPADDGRHFGLVVDDKEVARKALDAAGITLIDGPFLDFRDPWGNRVEIVGYDNIQFTKA